MVAIKDMGIPSDCYDCPFAKNKRTNDYGSFCECGILEDYETINLYKHNKHPNCPLVEIGTCGNCEHYKRIELNSCDEVIATCKKSTDINYHYVSPNFYCKDFKKRGNENDSN